MRLLRSLAVACETISLLAVLLLMTACASTAPRKENEQFDALVDQLSIDYFQQLPEMATYTGAPQELAPQANRRLTDRSVRGNYLRIAQVEKLFRRLQRTPAAGLDVARRLFRESLLTLMDGALAPARVVPYGSAFSYYDNRFLPYAINHLSGPALEIIWTMEGKHGLANDADVRAYIERLRAIPKVLDDTIAKARRDASLGVLPPKFILAKTQQVIDQMAATPPSQTPLYTNLVEKLAVAKISHRDVYARQALQITSTGILPAYRRISEYLSEVASQASTEAGLWSLPNGDKLYQALIRQMTDLDLQPADIYALGLKDVSRITEEMEQLLQANGYAKGTVGERMMQLAAEVRYQYPNTDAGRSRLLADISEQLQRVNAELPAWFGVLPRYRLEVRKVPEASQDNTTTAYYDSPTADGTHPGIYWINLRDLSVFPKYTLPTLTFHEAVPGHHLQFATSIDSQRPFIANAFWSNATGEGWALYAEALAAEMGLYENDWAGNLGRLQDELHRAVRLVVDTGMHAMRWSRPQAIAYMSKTEGISLSEATAEVDRYVVWPAQALSYKIGMMRIQKLRERAKAAQGDAFDIKEFHDTLVALSASPLPVLEREMRNRYRSTAAASPDHPGKPNSTCGKF